MHLNRQWRSSLVKTVSSLSAASAANQITPEYRLWNPHWRTYVPAWAPRVGGASSAWAYQKAIAKINWWLWILEVRINVMWAASTLFWVTIYAKKATTATIKTTASKPAPLFSRLGALLLVIGMVVTFFISQLIGVYIAGKAWYCPLLKMPLWAIFSFW